MINCWGKPMINGGQYQYRSNSSGRFELIDLKKLWFDKWLNLYASLSVWIFEFNVIKSFYEWGEVAKVSNNFGHQHLLLVSLINMLPKKLATNLLWVKMSKRGAQICAMDDNIAVNASNKW